MNLDGLDTRESDRIALIAKNRERLNECRLHVFDTSSIDWERKRYPDELVCMCCHGRLPIISAAEYARGFAAAGGDPETVIQGFSR